ncbi:Complement C3 [Merluccius polli]|uniref:Complement C3 n=1 Tax=Merluccius polli TaxID=89951 RepID=A0AA47N8B3_MERPO|nr:Complement C3 [Merluccius polli]
MAVLPSFEVILSAEEHFILLGSDTFHFTIEAKYLYGQSVAGSFNAWFRVGGLQASEHCLKVSQMIRGLEKTDSITDGRGTVTLSTMELEKQLQVQGCNLTYLEQNGAKLVMVVSVILRLPDGSAASDVPVHLHLQSTTLQSTAEVLTNQEGAAVHLFPLPATHHAEIVVKVKADTTEQEKVIRSMSSLLGPHLYINVPNNRLRVGQPLGVNFQIINGHPKDGFLYYLVLSRGVLVHQGSLEPMNKMGFKQIQITAHMVPSLRLIGYYYSEHDVIVSDSVWLDVTDECETRVKVYSSRKKLDPGQTAQLEVEVQGEALVALGVVDKAMYAITGPNKLTAKQVFSAMESYDLGCSFGGGADHTAVFTDAGLSFVSSEGNLSAELQECCDQGFTQIPMRRSCEERQKKVSQMKKANPECVEIFLKCCLQGEAMRKRTAQDNGLGRRFCVAEPFEIMTFKNIFVSLRLPYSVRKHEQMSIVAVIYNYGQDTSQLAVYMEQAPGLCSTASSFVNISVNPESSQLVTFAAVPMMSGAIPIKIRLFDINRRRETDAIEKNLNVLTEGEEKTEEFTMTLKFAGRRTFKIDGNLPDGTVPGSVSNILMKMEGAEFGQSSARALLSAKGVSDLLKLPHGCAEQTMKIMAPTVLALRYLDLSKQWVQLPTGTRDLALKSTEQVLSLLAERQSVGVGQRGHMGRDVTNEDISHSVRFLLSVQKPDGSFTDPNPVLDRSLQGGVSGVEGEMAMTAFITVALQHSIPFVDQNMKRDVEAAISKSTAHLLSHLKKLRRPYAVAITAYCLAVCLPDRADAKPAWQQLQALATLDNNGCRLWKSDPKSLAAAAEDAITVETTAYALLTAVAHEDSEYADAASCWLVGQENYGGGFMSTQVSPS